MKLAPRKPAFMMVLTVGMLVLLPVLAILQYHWMGQVSEGERERLQRNLREGAKKFTEDFDREIARLFFNFHRPSLDKGAHSEQEFAACYTRWSQETAYPRLIKDIYSIVAGADGELHLRRFNTTTQALEEIGWPDELSEVKERLHKQLSSPPFNLSVQLGELRLPESRKSDVMQIMEDDISPIVPGIPALIIRRLPLETGNVMTVLSLNPPDFVVLTLDMDTITQKVIPQLAAAYFSGSNGLDYNLTVVNRRAPSQIIYQSDEVALNPAQTNDATANLLNISINTLVEQRKEQYEIQRAAGTRAGGSDTADPKKRARIVQLFRGDSVTTSDAPGSPLSGDNGAWQLLLKHRAGSLGTVVAAARYRNLAISFGILLLLTVSMGMILLSTRRAERLANQQMEFVAGVSHELRTPLAVIRSAGENLADGVIDESAQIKRYGSLIASEGRRLSEMVEQILEFSGIHSGRKTYTLRPAEVADVIENAIAACLPQAAENDFEISKEIADDLPLVAADEAALSRSLQNLLTNAMKYSGTSRIIEIKAQADNAHDKNSGVQITVADHGLGIDTADLPHIFEPFYRGRDATEAQIHGSGLGLSLVKQIITAHDGEISVSTTKGKGSAFTIHLKSLTQKSGESRESRESGESMTTFVSES